MSKKRKREVIYVKSTGEEKMSFLRDTFKLDLTPHDLSPSVKEVKGGKIDYYGHKIPVSKLTRKGNYGGRYMLGERPLYSIPGKVVRGLKKKKRK